MTQAEAQKARRRFERRSRLLSAALAAAGIIILASCLIAAHRDSLTLLLISVTALALWFVVFCITADRLNRTRLNLNQQARIHTGLFADLTSEFEQTKFKDLTDAEILFAESHGDTIELELHCNNKTCHIIIDPEAIFLVTDEEGPNASETELPLADFRSTAQVLTTLRALIDQP